MRSAVLLAAVLVLVVPATSLAAPSAATQTAFDSTVTIDVYIESSGDARINVSTTYALNSTAEREAFERVAANFSDGRVGFQAGDFRAFAAGASEATGREMAVTGVERVTEVRNESGNATGILALELTWTNFANLTGPRIVVDDVFESGWLGHLEPDMRLQVSSDYRLHDAPVALTDGMLVWDGPYTFEDGGPRVVFERALNTPTTSTPTTTEPPGGGFDGEFQLVVAILAVLLVGGFLAYVWTRRDGMEPVATDDAAGDDGDGGDESEGDLEDEDPGADHPDADDPPAEAGATDREADDAEMDAELLSDEERVERMLRENGGRMKQANIVKETGWSNAKVSQLLSSMDEEGRIEKLRLGRENLIMLEGEDPVGPGDGDGDGDEPGT